MENKDYLISDIKNQNDGETIDFEIPEQYDKKIVAYTSILVDLQICKDALLELKKNNSLIVQTSLFTTVIILYGKCFTDSSTSSSSNLQLTIFDDNIKFKELHLELMNSRHNFIAHRGITKHEYGKAFFQINVKTLEWGFKIGVRRRHSFEPKEIVAYLRLIEFLLTKVQDKYSKAQERVLEYIKKSIIDGKGLSELKMLDSDNSVFKNFTDRIRRK